MGFSPLERFILIIIMLNTLKSTNSENDSSESRNNHSLESAQLTGQQEAALKAQYVWLKCIADRHLMYKLMNYQTKAIAFLISEGQSITLDSWMCFLGHKAEEATVHWKFLSLKGAAVNFIEQDGDKYFIHSLSKNLEINHLSNDDTGYYYSTVNYVDELAVYFIEVSNNDELHSVSDEKYSSEEIYVPTHNLRIYLRLGEWTACDTCGKDGSTYKSGICFVEDHSNPQNESMLHQSIPHTFYGGLPCRSRFLPPTIKELTEINDMKSIRIKKACRVPCQTLETFNSDSDLHNQQQPDKSKSIIKQGFLKSRMPPLPPLVTSKTIFQEKEKGVIIICPGKHNSMTIMMWKFNAAILEPQLVYLTTMGRISMDGPGRIRIRNLQMNDSGTYSCWAGETQIGIVYLVAQDRFEPPIYIQSLISLASYIIVLLMLLFIGLKMLITSCKQS